VQFELPSAFYEAQAEFGTAQNEKSGSCRFYWLVIERLFLLIGHGVVSETNKSRCAGVRSSFHRRNEECEADVAG